VAELLDQIQRALGERYLIERELGRGGMALVFLARDRKYERQVAIKVLDPEICTAIGAERFLREIRITAQLQHTNIVPLLDSGEAGPLLYSVMPYIEGETLRDRLMARSQLGVTEAATIAAQVADALDYAHRRGVIHRDIKPENILISNGHAVVADFGIARAIGLAGGATLTGSGFPIGTVAYMSPEQATAASPVDGRSDIYSLGCVLYEMLTGRMAFSGPSLKSVLNQQITSDPPPVQLSRPDVPASLGAVVRRSLAKNPADRFQTAAELAEALQGALAELPRVSTPIPRGPGAVPPPVGSGASRNLMASAGKWLVPAALLALVALVISWLFGSSRPDRVSGEAGPYTASVAVLPFSNLNGDSADDYFSEGITDEIISQLAQVESLKVISRTSVLALKGASLTLPQIADTLGVRHVVEGTIRRQGNRVRVRAELIEARSDAHLWAGSFEGDLADSFRVQEEIARKVSGELLSSIRGTPAMARSSMPSQSAAFDAFLHGRYLLAGRTPEAIGGAIRRFQDAVGLDSTYAPAYAGLSSAYSVWVRYGYPGEPERYRAAARALLLADRALALDPELAAAHHARADALGLAEEPQESVLAEVRTAQRLMPNAAEIRMSAAFALESGGRRDEALRQGQSALDLDPLSTGLRHGTIVLALAARRYDVAFEEARRARSLGGRDPVTLVLQAYALLLKGDPARCVGLEVGPWVAVKAMCLHSVGRTGEAKALSDSLAADLLQGRYANVHQYADLAAYYAWLGDVDRSVEWLGRAVRLTPVINYWQIDCGLFDRVRDDSRFRAALARFRDDIRARLAQEREKLKA
jgi:serine/threonine-protein kinase